MWHYNLLTFDCQRLSAPFINIFLPGPRASIDSRWPPSSDSTLVFQKKVHLQTTRWSPTSVVVQIICKFINKKEIGLPLYAIPMQNKPNTFPCHPAVLDCRNLFSFLHFTLSWHHHDHKICTNNIFGFDICFTT